MFPTPLRPIEVDDSPAAENAMGRPALISGVTTPRGQHIELVTCHLKPKLLNSPAGRSPPGMGAARPLRRLRAVPPGR
jgi:hypothetical protein